MELREKKKEETHGFMNSTSFHAYMFVYGKLNDSCSASMANIKAVYDICAENSTQYLANVVNFNGEESIPLAVCI